MTQLDKWLIQATRHLSAKSTAEVRSEIEEHYGSAREAAIRGGATPEAADGMALSALGDAKTANREYRKVLLTSAEARMLRDGNWEARAVCSRLWLKRLLLATPTAALLAAAGCYLVGSIDAARVLLAAGLGIGIFFAGPFLPVYTPLRGRIYRCVKCVLMIAALALAFETAELKSSWLLISCIWPFAWIEWTRMSIRRKLPVAQWPKQLYL